MKVWSREKDWARGSWIDVAPAVPALDEKKIALLG